MKRDRVIAAVALALAAAALVGAVSAYAAQGDQSDPLVTLSYLEQVVTPKLNEAVDAAVAKNAEELQKQLDIAITSYENRVDEKLAQAGGAAFVSKTLARGETLTLPAGREILLVSGEATAAGTLTDTTAGATVRKGERLTAGHLYVTAAENSGVQAGGAVTVMSR